MELEGTEERQDQCGRHNNDENRQESEQEDRRPQARLKRIIFNDKILATVPPSIRKKGERDVLAYFRDLTGTSLVPFNAAKVMVLGKEVAFVFVFVLFFIFKKNS